MGQKFRALTGAQLDDLGRMEVDLNGARKLNENLQADNAQLEKQNATLLSEKAQLEIKFNASEQKVASLQTDLSGSRVDTNRYFVLLSDEVKARGQAQQFIPHSGAKGVVGKFLELLDKPAVQLGFKVGLPLLQGARALTGCR
jgi:chromosome segregation ATPase